jgi:hypothetical protein
MAKSQAQIRHEQDVETLAKELLRAAKEHELCDTLFEEIDRINKKLNMPIKVERPAKKATGTLNIDVTFENPVDAVLEQDRNWGPSIEGIKDQDRFMELVEKAIRDIVKTMYSTDVVWGLSVEAVDLDMVVWEDDDD